MEAELEQDFIGTTNNQDDQLPVVQEVQMEAHTDRDLLGTANNQEDEFMERTMGFRKFRSGGSRRQRSNSMERRRLD